MEYVALALVNLTYFGVDAIHTKKTDKLKHENVTFICGYLVVRFTNWWNKANQPSTVFFFLMFFVNKIYGMGQERKLGMEDNNAHNWGRQEDKGRGVCVETMLSYVTCNINPNHFLNFISKWNQDYIINLVFVYQQKINIYVASSLDNITN